MLYRAQYRNVAVSTLNYVVSRIADLADVSVALIITGDFTAGKPNAYMYVLVAFIPFT